MSYDVVGIASIVEDRVLPDCIAALREMQLASVGWGCSLEVHRSLYRPSYQSLRQCYSHQTFFRYCPSCRLEARLGDDTRHEVALTLCRVEEIGLAVLCDSAVGVVIMHGDDRQVRRCRSQVPVLLGNKPASFPSPSSTTFRVVFVTVRGFAVMAGRASNLVCVGVQSPGNWTRDGRA